MRGLILASFALMFGETAYGQMDAQDVVRMLQNNANRAARRAAEANQDQGRLLPPRVVVPRQPTRGMQARINAHRANRVNQILARRVKPSPVILRGVALGVGSALAMD
jgi:hypothetical protein